MRVSRRYRFDARGPATHGAAHAAVPSRLLCIYSNYVTSRIHCSPHHWPAKAAERRRARPSSPEGAATAHMALRSVSRPVTCRFASHSVRDSRSDRSLAVGPSQSLRDRAPRSIVHLAPAFS